MTATTHDDPPATATFPAATFLGTATFRDPR
jgi:hypothetical protein